VGSKQAGVKNMEKLIEAMTTYYNGNYPKSVTEYMSNYPKGYSRTTLSEKYGLKVSTLLSMLTEYVNPISSDYSNDKVRNKATLDGLAIISDLTTFGSKDKKLVLECTSCGYIHTCSKSSYLLTAGGCMQCRDTVSNLPLSKGDILDRLQSKYGADYTIEESDIPDAPARNTSRHTRIRLTHKSCGTQFDRNMWYLAYGVGTNMCKNCWPSSVYSCVHDGLTFNSKFEYECYKLIVAKLPDSKVILHCRYRDIIDTNRLWTADFIIDNKLVLEVTSYNSDSEYSKFKAHSNNLADKEAAIKLDGNYMFFVARSLPELNNILTGYLTQDIV